VPLDPRRYSFQSRIAIRKDNADIPPPIASATGSVERRPDREPTTGSA
jgi:hypothetical protein